MKKRFVYLFILPVLLSGLSAHATAYFTQHLSITSLQISRDASPLMLAADQEQSEVQPQPEASGLLVPAASEESGDEMTCMTVCSGWGEECILTGNAEGVVSKKCRRACKSFSEECL